MIRLFGGGGGGLPPGVAGDGQVPGGLNVAGALQVTGDTTLGDPVGGTLTTVSGSALMAPPVPYSYPVLELQQYGGMYPARPEPVLRVARQAQGGTVQTQEMVQVTLGDNTTTPDYIHCYSFSGTRDISLSSAGSIGLFSHTPPASKPTVTGSRSDGTALASLLTALASYGLVLDSTTA